MRPSCGAGVCEQGDQASLEGAKAPLDLALGLRGGSHEVGGTQSQHGSLELAFGIAMVVGGTRSEEAQAVGVEDLGKPPAGEGFAEVLEVIPSGVRSDETARQIESGGVVHGE